jgi:hypothetical protein
MNQHSRRPLSDGLVEKIMCIKTFADKGYKELPSEILSRVGSYAVKRPIHFTQGLTLSGL